MKSWGIFTGAGAKSSETSPSSKTELDMRESMSGACWNQDTRRAHEGMYMVSMKEQNHVLNTKISRSESGRLVRVVGVVAALFT